jgi:hypothetical protein
MARHLLGFANRHPDAAAAAMGGCGYLVVGVEPAKLHGVQPIDSAQLGKAIDRYTGGTAGPRWSPDYVDYQGFKMLVITVEPPAWGDPIHTLKQGYDRYLPGTIFIRRIGETEQANPAEVAMVQERAARRTPRIAIGLRWAEGAPEILAAGTTNDEVARWADRERAELMRHLDEYREPATKLAAFAGLNSVFGEQRTPADYRKQVEDYIAGAMKAMLARIIGTAVLRSSPMGVVLVNRAEGNFSDVRCALHIEGKVWAVGGQK